MDSVSTLKQIESASSSSLLLAVFFTAFSFLATNSFFFGAFLTRGAFTFLTAGARKSLWSVEFHLFLMALSVLPGKDFAISAHLLP
jgi:hypothetical protein